MKITFAGSDGGIRSRKERTQWLRFEATIRTNDTNERYERTIRSHDKKTVTYFGFEPQSDFRIRSHKVTLYFYEEKPMLIFLYAVTSCYDKKTVTTQRYGYDYESTSHKLTENTNLYNEATKKIHDNEQESSDRYKNSLFTNKRKSPLINSHKQKTVFSLKRNHRSKEVRWRNWAPKNKER